jgi:integrase
LSAQWAADQLPFPWSRRQIASAHRPAFDRSRRHVRVGTEWKQLVVAHSRCQNQKPSCTFAAVAGDGPRDYRRRTEDRWPRSGVHYQRQVWTEQLGRCQTRSRYRDGWHRRKERGRAVVIRHWTLHDLRRSFTSGLQSVGVAPQTIERALNHSSGTFGRGRRNLSAQSADEGRAVCLVLVVTLPANGGRQINARCP